MCMLKKIKTCFTPIQRYNPFTIFDFLRVNLSKSPNIPPGLELFPHGFGIKLPLFLHKPLGARGVRVKTPREAQGKVRQELPGLLEI